MGLRLKTLFFVLPRLTDVLILVKGKTMIELKSIKVHDRLSEETLCFSANLYYQGKKVGEVSNQGCGGCHDVHLVDRALYPVLETYAKSLPPVEIQGEMYNMDLDLLIDRKVDEYLKEKDQKRVQKFIDKHIKANAAKGLKTLKLTQANKVSCLPIKPTLNVTQELINQYQIKNKVTITNWEVV